MITCYWPYLLKKEFIKVPKYGTINFHPALLPYNRGWYPSVWPFIDGSPAGVTLHLIDEGADTGPIIAQREIAIKETDNGGTIYKKSQEAMIQLFKETWKQLYTNGIELKYQDNDKATYHSKKDANDLDRFKITDYSAEYLFNLIRAKTFGDKCFAYYVKDGIKYRVRLDITKDNG
jgi:methionyl-tRNA formyltransferase